jgi:hypothetical protein
MPPWRKTARRCPRSLLVSLLVAAPAAAQVTWTRHSPTVSPPARRSHALAYDLGRQRVVLFGGLDAALLSDTWEWDGSTWTQRAPAASPPARYAHALAHDLLRQRTVLFGGWSGASRLADTWEWDGSTWTQRTPAASPAARSWHSMVYDVQRQRVVLFGGERADFGGENDVWEWDGSNWTQRSVPSPPPRRAAGLAYDSFRGRTVLFGGLLPPNTKASDTFENWTLQSPATSPPARGIHALAYDATRQRTVLFGGEAQGFGILADTWEWNGNDWTRRFPLASPPARAYHALAFDLVRGRTVLFGGVDSQFSALGDTWELGPQHEAAYVTFGAGCAGSAGTPALAAAGGQRPWIGESFTLVLTRLPGNATAAILLGSSRTSWGSLTLPLRLDAIGMTGCWLLASGELQFPVTPSGGMAALTLPVPNDPGLLGGMFFNQGLVGDPPANPLGATTSNGGEGKIGGK